MVKRKAHDHLDVKQLLRNFSLVKVLAFAAFGLCFGFFFFWFFATLVFYYFTIFSSIGDFRVHGIITWKAIILFLNYIVFYSFEVKILKNHLCLHVLYILFKGGGNTCRREQILQVYIPMLLQALASISLQYVSAFKLLDVSDFA